MQKLLFRLGIFSIVIGVISGLLTQSFLGFILAAVSGTISSVIYFALARVLENQDDIRYQLMVLQEMNSKKLRTVNCLNCGKAYTEDHSSCPHCGAKNT